MKTKVFITGNASNSEVEEMVKMINFFEMEPIGTILVSGIYDPVNWKIRLLELVEEAECVFACYDNYDNPSNSYMNEELKIAELLSIPVYYKNEVKDMIVKKSLGEEIKISVTKNRITNNICNNSIDFSKYPYGSTPTNISFPCCCERYFGGGIGSGDGTGC